MTITPIHRTAEGTFTKPPTDVSALSEQTEKQGDLLAKNPAYPSGPYSAGQSWLFSNGGDCFNPCGFPYYSRAYTRSYWTYRWMLQHPTLRLVRSICNSPIIASTWGFKKSVESVPDENVQLITDMITPLRRRFVEDALRGKDYGWCGFELIWQIRNGKYWLTELKPLLNDITQIVTDDNGRFTGLAQGEMTGNIKTMAYGDSGQKVFALPAPYKAWIYTYDREAGNKYGRSWLENVRETAWKDWLDCAQQLQKLGAKLSGIQTICKSPAVMKDAVIAAVQDLSNGAAGAWVPSLAMAADNIAEVDQMKLMIDLAKSSFAVIEPIDFGSTAPAIEGLLSRMAHDEEMMFQGGLRPSRVGLEGQHGTKAEAGVHTTTGIAAAELDDDDLADQFQPVIDAILYLNSGPRAVGTIRIETPPLVDTKAQNYLDILKAALNDQQVGPVLKPLINWTKLLGGIDVPVMDQEALRASMVELTTDPLKFQKELAAFTAQQTAQNKPDNKQTFPSRGNGNAERAVNRFDAAKAE